MLSSNFQDDRKQLRPLASLGLLGKRAGTPGYPSRQAINRIGRATKEAQKGHGVFGLLSLVSLGLLVVWVFGFTILNIALPPGPYVFWVKLVWFVVVAAASQAAARILSRGRIARSIAATLVAESICASCGYQLADLGVEPDGCVVCPECGAAWRHERMVQRLAGAAHKPDEPIHRRRLLGIVAPELTPDERGRLLELPDSRLRLLSTKRRSELGPETTAQLRKTFRKIGRPTRLVVGLLVLLASVGLVLGVAAMRAPNRRFVFDSGDFWIGAVGAVLATLLFRSELGIHVVRFRRECAEILRCPSCLEPLNGIAAGADSLITCPRCGGGWRFPQGRQTPPTGPLPPGEATHDADA